MKGLGTNWIVAIVLAFVALVIILMFIHHTIQPSTPGYLGLPDGVWMEVKSADTKTFVFPPVLWFGKNLSLDGKWVDYSKIYTSGDAREFIFPTNNVYIKEIGRDHTVLDPKSFDYLELLISALRPPNIFCNYFSLYVVPILGVPLSGTYNYIFKVTKPVQPTIAFYPLVTDNFNSVKPNAPVEKEGDLYYLKNNEPYGKLNLTLKFDLKKLEKYYESKGYSLGSDETEWKRNIKIGDSTLEELETEGNCSEIGVDGAEYSCSFRHFAVERCCLSSVTISPPEVKVNLTGANYDIQEKMPITPISFMIVYYVDKLKDRDYIFENDEKIFSGYTEHIEGGPINIYPCRAIVNYTKFELLRNIKGLGGMEINWDECRDSSNYVRLKYKDLDENSTWYCKENDGNYSLYNPYGFCKLTYNTEKDKLELPSFPGITYLPEVIPSGKFTKEVKEVPLPYWWGGWNIAKINIPDIPYASVREAASALAHKVIKESVEILSGTSSGHLTLFKTKTGGGCDVTINYNFED